MIGIVLIIALTAAGVAALIRLLIGPTLADRVIALDVGLISLMSGITVHAATNDVTSVLDIPVVIAIVGFTATVAAARFIERDHEDKQR